MTSGGKAKFVDDLVKAMAGDKPPTARQIEIAEGIYAKTIPQPKPMQIYINHGPGFWEWIFIILTVWACAVAYNYLDWQWSLEYDRAVQEAFASKLGTQ